MSEEILVEAITAENERLKALVTHKDMQLQQLNAQVASVVAELEEFKNRANTLDKLLQLEDENTNLKKEIDSLRGMISSLHQEMDRLRKNAKDFEDNASDMHEAEIRDLKGKMHDLSVELERKSQVKDSTIHTVHDVHDVSQQTIETNSTMMELEGMINDLRSSNEAFQMQHNELQKKYESQHEEMKNKISSLILENNRLKERLNDVNK
mgnify:CR=1 FL=1